MEVVFDVLIWVARTGPVGSMVQVALEIVSLLDALSVHV
jgi:hypothetical protein